MGEVATPKIILYTSYVCPWAHRAQIILKELGLPFETVHIDLTVPRTEEYLQINPRGLVPTINYNGDIITESGIISQFLADVHPSHILKTSTEKGGALSRARIAFFTDAFFSKVQSQFFGLLTAPVGTEQEAKASTFIAAIVKELEPLLQDAKPFFGGNEKIGFAEVLTGSFILRILSFPKQGLLPESLLELQSKAPAFWKWANAVVEAESVNYIWDEKKVVDIWKGKVEKIRADNAAK